MLNLFDTASGTVRPLPQRDPGQVSMYVCGPTVYDLPHIGHGRYSLVFDVLRRYLLFGGLEVRYVSNVTDIEDKIIKRAAEQGRTEPEVAEEFEAAWFEAMDALGVLRPTVTPHATQYVAQMVELIAELLERGVAYTTSSGVYFEVDRVPGYGLLAGQPLDSLRAGARVEADEEKRSPLDFVLWKGARDGEPAWSAPWGEGRPGWHTECVVMSLDLLGEGFDLHGGGQDLRFPHHENERAQAVADGRTFATHWAHNGWVEVAGEKMSKSLGNFTTLTDLLERSDARAYRLLVLQSHYRAPIEVTPETIGQAERSLERLDALVRRLGVTSPLADAPYVAGVPATEAVAEPAVREFEAHLDDDLDTPRALARVFSMVTEANAEADAGHPVEAVRLARTVALLAGVLGLELGGADDVPDDETAALIAARAEARAARDWVRSDVLRDEIVTRGWLIEDGPTGTSVRRSGPPGRERE